MEEQYKYYKNILKKKENTLNDFHKTTRLSNILKIINTEAYEWYESIPPLRIETNEI